ncbi:hypothetical protein LTR66_016428 [Elasticomyces elasticus]|nr:hypothetical protein LTR66_016428 [Elasticomyces elasticus]
MTKTDAVKEAVTHHILERLLRQDHNGDENSNNMLKLYADIVGTFTHANTGKRDGFAEIINMVNHGSGFILKTLKAVLANMDTEMRVNLRAKHTETINEAIAKRFATSTLRSDQWLAEDNRR